MAAWQLGSWSIEVERRRTGLSVGTVSMPSGHDKWAHSERQASRTRKRHVVR
jgi:hypothetical protein